MKQQVSELKQKLQSIWIRYRIPAIFFLVGIAILLLPTGRSSGRAAQAYETQSQFDLAQTQERLAEILSRIEGAGRVELMLTLAAGQETVYQTDERRVTSESGVTAEKDTVLLSQSGAEKAPIVTLTRYPKYQGALIVCDGADSPSVRLSIVAAVSSLTGLGSDHISVIKMKGQ